MLLIVDVYAFADIAMLLESGDMEKIHIYGNACARGTCVIAL